MTTVVYKTKKEKNRRAIKVGALLNHFLTSGFAGQVGTYAHDCQVLNELDNALFHALNDDELRAERNVHHRVPFAFFFRLKENDQTGNINWTNACQASLGFWYAVEREQIGRLVRVRASEAEGQISRSKLRIGKEQ
ncbi:hypothetical protein OUZ56_027855 [Daphnia magna]|uniref:Uncharacterized protein n=1 Tax=Daphnia magna TaxID=35525 RepID=A0ABR0B248_9CRUS|nr:hypothetical protein OUZ56_027855 [Daphnia magna]